jgi:hypothetical protein
LIVAGIAMWGLLVLCIHAYCLAALVHGTARPLRPMAAAFLAQLTASAIVAAMLQEEVFVRVASVWTVCATLAVGYFIWSFARQRREEET